METETHLFALRAPKGTGQRQAMELLRKALVAQGHPLTVESGATMSLSADGGAVLSLSASDGYVVTIKFAGGMPSFPGKIIDKFKEALAMAKADAVISDGRTKWTVGPCPTCGQRHESPVSLSADCPSLSADPSAGTDSVAAGRDEGARWQERQLQARSMTSK